MTFDEDIHLLTDEEARVGFVEQHHPSRSLVRKRRACHFAFRGAAGELSERPEILHSAYLSSLAAH